MVTIGSEHIGQLIQVESGIRYNVTPEDGKLSFLAISRPSSVLLSAPHGARTLRNNGDEIWHEEDEYTAGMALLLGELCDASVIATVAQNDQYDPNYHRGCAYKDRLREVIVGNGVRYVLDLHGAALNSKCLSPAQTIDLGYRDDAPRERSMEEPHIRRFENLLADSGNPCLAAERNHFRAAGGKASEPIATFVHHLHLGFRVQALQIEMKPQVRVAHRFPNASLYKSCGAYDADPQCVTQMLQALADFVDYLKRAA